MNNFYNNEEQEFSKLIKDLKSLPKVEAPDNFEFNLMMRIENKNFGEVKEERPKFNWLKFFAPSAAVVTAVLLFVVFYPQKDEIQTQITKQVKPDSQSIVSNTSNGKFESLFDQKEEKPSNQTSQRNSKQQNYLAEAVPQQPTQQYYNQKRGYSVDDYISGAKANRNPSVSSSIVNSGDQPMLDGFLIEKKTDKKTLERMRAQADSIRKAQLRADSLKKAIK